MSPLLKTIFGERSITKVAGLFTSRYAAETAARRLVQDSGLDESQIDLLEPADGRAPAGTRLARKVEPEQAGIWHTILRAHLTLGLVGAFLGSLIHLGLWSTGEPVIRSTPLLSYWALTGFGATFGMLVAGLIALRPDHGRVLALVRRWLKRGRWAVVVHPLNPTQTHEAVHALRAGSERVLRSL